MTDTQPITLLIIGGYGTFGGKLARLLCDEPALTIIVAGRSFAKANAFCQQLQGAATIEAQCVDRNGDLDTYFEALHPDIVVDASGPFQTFKERPYRVVEAAIAHGAHYLDLSDGSEFVLGIEAFDTQAKAQGLTILSGVSSFPVLTAAAVRSLSSDFTEVTQIIAGVAPSPHAGVGLNVVRAIAEYAGKKIALRRNGMEVHGYGLTETVRYTIAPPGQEPMDSLTFSLVDVPDLNILCKLWPDVKTVWVGAGPVPGSLHALLRCIARLVKWRIIPSLAPIAKIMHWAVNNLTWGRHQGGMFVEVEGKTNNNELKRCSWHMIAEGDHGPFIPAMAVAALVKKWLRNQPPEPGARVATGEVELSDYHPFFAERKIRTGERLTSTQTTPLYASVLQDKVWQQLPLTLQKMHADVLEARGKAEVTRGKSLLAKLIARVFGFPEAGEDIDVVVRFERTAEQERWHRNFAGKDFYSDQFIGTGRYQHLLCEQFGPFVFGMALVFTEGRLRLLVRKWKMFGIPLPRFLLPNGEFYEEEQAGRFRFNVAIEAPLIGPIVCYRGYLIAAD